MSPSPSQAALLDHAPFCENEPKPRDSIPFPARPEQKLIVKPGVVSRMFGGQKRYEKRVQNAQQQLDGWVQKCEQIELHNRQEHTNWQQAHKDWCQRFEAYQEEIAESERAHIRKLETDSEYACNVLAASFDQLEWPRETLVTLDIPLEDRTVWIDVDLPEIEDLPNQIAMLSSSGKKLNVKAKPQKALRLEYARHVHGIVFRLAATAFLRFPT